MGLNINGRGVAAMRHHGAEALEARLNGAVVWPETPVDPWPEKPYLELANGEWVRLLECRYDPTPHDPYPGGVLTAPGGAECSAFYPDAGSPGIDLGYRFRNGCAMEYAHGVEFRLLDSLGAVLEPKQPLPDMANTYGLTLFYAEVEGTLCMGFWYGSVSDLTIRSRASGGIPGTAVTRREHSMYGLTATLKEQYHRIALALLRREEQT